MDGIWMLVTNITETMESEEYRLKPEELISAYRDKNRIEEAFRDVKSFIKFQPTFVYTDDHVRAHYTICILSYLMDMKGTDCSGLKLMPLTDEQKSVLKLFDCDYLVRRNFLKSIGVKGL